MSNSNSSIEKHPTKTGSKYECLDCENYKRKVKEAEQTVSGRDVLIEMLQGEIKKMEGRYKVSIDDYESLRFKYCTVVQELSNLKEIHKKLEKSQLKLAKERDLAKGQLELLQNEIMESCKKQCKELTIELIPTESEGIKPLPSTFHDTILKEMMNIEVIIQNQNATVKDVLQKVLNEMKGVKSSKQIEEVLQNTTSYSKYNDNTKDQNKDDLLATIADLSNQLNVQTALVEELKAENYVIKTQLEQKKSNLAQCLDVLEDNHSNLNSLSGNIDMIISEKETYQKEIEELKNTIKNHEGVLEQKDREISELKNKFQQQSDVNLRRDNDNLRRELNECQKELEQLQEDYLEKTRQCNIERCTQLAKALIEAKSTGDKRMKDIISNIENEIIETSKQGEKSSSENKEMDEIDELTEKIKTLEQNLEQVKLENSEFEEENKYYTQKIESLVTHIQVLEKEKKELQNDEEKLRIDELKREYENLNFQKEREIKELKDEINYLKQSVKNRESKDEIVQTEKVFRANDPEKAEISAENEYLKNQILTLENEIMHIQEEDEKHILMLQDKIDQLENSQNKKQKEIDECCCVVRNIKETIADKNFIDENNIAHITLLEEQNCQLQQQINALRAELATYEDKYKGCDCLSNKPYTEVQDLEDTVTQLQTDNKQMEVELCQRVCIAEKLQTDMKEMEIEICRRQCTINHLEQCLDKSNKILAECEKEMKAMHYENENLKKENNGLRENIKEFAFETERTSVEKSALLEKVTAITRQSQQLEMEKYHLSKNLQSKTDLEDQLKQMKREYNDLAKTLQQRDHELEAARNQIESSKREYGKVLKAYKEVKDTLSEEIEKYNTEREKMNREVENMKVDFKKEEKCTACSNVKELNSIILEKERLVKSLQCQNRELGSEVTQLKTYVNKLISDNKHLRTAIDNLLETLVEKLKNFTETEDISLQSNEMIVKDILTSLIDLEQDVMTTNSTVGEKCNCMSVIMSTYKVNAKDARSKSMPACKQKCGKRIKDMSKYTNMDISSSHGIVNVCADCCQNRPDKPSHSHKYDSSYDFLVEPGPSS